ncbi:MAG TPA: hypothetical protein DCQ43_06385 [Treponema sp.]|jgi:hypothetical protein|nr:hypothetical protein [Treponema sp.]
MKKEPSQERQNSLLFTLTQRFSLFLAGALIMSMLLYVTGNFQQFLDGTQEIILIIASISSLGLIIFSAAGIIQSIVFGIVYKHKRFWFALIPFGLAELLAVTLLIVSRMILTLTGGYAA